MSAPDFPSASATAFQSGAAFALPMASAVAKRVTDRDFFNMAHSFCVSHPSGDEIERNTCGRTRGESLDHADLETEYGDDGGERQDQRRPLDAGRHRYGERENTCMQRVHLCEDRM